METTVDFEAKGCTFQWKIKNFCRWDFIRGNPCIASPVFIANALEKTKWRLRLFPKKRVVLNYEVERNFVGIYLLREVDGEAPDGIKVSCGFAFLEENGSILREMTCEPFIFKMGDYRGWDAFVEHEKVFESEKKRFLPEDTLTVQCTLWNTDKKPNKLDHLFGTTVIEEKRRSLFWKIHKPFVHKSDIVYKFKDGFGFDLVIETEDWTPKATFFRYDESVKYASLNISIAAPYRGSDLFLQCFYYFFDHDICVFGYPVEFSGRINYYRGLYFPDDVWPLHLELVSLTLEQSDCRKYSATLESKIGGNEKPLSTDMVINDLNGLYNDDTLKDMEFRTKTKTFKAHKAILSARSNKFRNMFISNREESTSGHEDIDGFDEDTVEEMLMYIYTGSLEDLSDERACKLHAISNYYEVISLKRICFSFLQDKLCQANACEFLVLADKYNDADLKTAVEDYILRHHKSILRSQEWKDLMKHHLKMAANVMNGMITKINF